jgi:nucleoside-diphosphate-sugar epimerase
MKTIFITGGTGYIGRRLISALLNRGHHVIALVRKGSEHKVPHGAKCIVGSPFAATTFLEHIPAGAVFIQLVGVAHPSPKKAHQFKDIDLRSVKVSADAAEKAKVNQFIYLSVAMTPSKLMKAYQQARKEGEKYCLSRSFNCTFIRPWYVLGPGHWWPLILLPFYGLAELIPSWRTKARGMALVRIGQVIRTLVNAVESQPLPIRIIEIQDIRHQRDRFLRQPETFRQKPSYL